MRPEIVTQPDAERAISTEALAFRKRVKVGESSQDYTARRAQPNRRLHAERVVRRSAP